MLLDSSEFRLHLESQLSKSSRCFFYSAFFTEPAAEWFITHRAFEKDDRLLIRARPADFLSGACAINAIDKVLRAGLTVKMSTALHAKIYAFDDHIYSGSANLTAKGLALINNHNDELGTSSIFHQRDLTLLNNLWGQAVQINDVILEKMKKFLYDKLTTNEVISSAQLIWPNDIENEKRDIYCSDFPQDYPSDDLRWKSERSLRQTLSYRWLTEALVDKREISFGNLTKKLHDEIYDDPTPYRREIKSLLSNLLSAVIDLDKTSLEVIQPNYRQVLRMRKNSMQS